MGKPKVPEVVRRPGEAITAFQSRRLRTQIVAIERQRIDARKAGKKAQRLDPEAHHSISINADALEAIVELRDAIDEVDRARELVATRVEQAVEEMQKDPALKWAQAAEEAQIEHFGRTVDTCAASLERAARALSQHFLGVGE